MHYVRTSLAITSLQLRRKITYRWAVAMNFTRYNFTRCNQSRKLYPRNLTHPRIDKFNEPRKFYPQNLICLRYYYSLHKIAPRYKHCNYCCWWKDMSLDELNLNSEVIKAVVLAFIELRLPKSSISQLIVSQSASQSVSLSVAVKLHLIELHKINGIDAKNFFGLCYAWAAIAKVSFWVIFQGNKPPKPLLSSYTL